MQVLKKRLLKKKNSGIIHIHSTLNNTLLTLTDSQGNTLGWSSSGSVGIKNSRKSSSYSAQLAGEDLGKKCEKKNIQLVEVKLKGIGYGKETSIEGLKLSGLTIYKISELTSIAYNGCRAPKKRRV
jgi:small subunit ribosomal protein S11